ncbi:pentapeptide repeat-containing protein [Fischerella sp. JS2]|uniref:pentapeptide repeat-containing protein n=1 Tax=Fischerella sp. JS2 TaxID=2597771 RepID=UPI0028F05C1D|nr:pentapeptide repeat-containing protein [Fischerella sp. JS2]
MNVEQLLRRYDTGERDFTGVEIVEFRLRHLTEINLSGSDFRYANLQKLVRYTEGIKLNLSCANLRGLNLEYAHFEHANLQKADLSYTDMWCAALHSADLTGADLSGAKLHEAVFYNVNLSRANLSGAHLLDTHFDYANLTEANFKYARKVNFGNAYLQDTIMPDGNIINVSRQV